MIETANNLPAGATLQADICIVGAGAAGISLALALESSGLTVLMLESGSLEANPATQALYAGEVADDNLHSPLDRYRERRFGGSTTIWGGRCMPLDPIDFDARDYVAHSGWPIDYGDVLPYYPEANRLCEAGEFAYTLDIAFARPLPEVLEGFTSRHYSVNQLERFSCPTNFGARYHHKLARSRTIRVLLGANLTDLRLGEDARTIISAGVAVLDGPAFSVQARRYVLATGGLETVRLLLASPGASGRGVGNGHDVVGRYYMCHIAGTIGALKVASGHRVSHGYNVSDEGVYCRRRFALTPATQRELRLSSFIARLHHPRIIDPAHKTGILSLLYLARFVVPYEYGKRLYGDEQVGVGATARHVGNVLTDIPGIVRFLAHWLRYRTLSERKFPSVIVRPRAQHYSLDFHAEQEPNPESRVCLGSTRDALGMPGLRVDWRYTEQDVHTVKASLALFAEDIRQSGVGIFAYDEAQVEAEMTRYGAYGGHHIGTARMGDDPRTSVVDAACRVHETDNLHVCGSAVFPTSSQANPTLTIVALALRLADHLRNTLTAGKH